MNAMRRRWRRGRWRRLKAAPVAKSPTLMLNADASDPAPPTPPPLLPPPCTQRQPLLLPRTLPLPLPLHLWLSLFWLLPLVCVFYFKKISSSNVADADADVAAAVDEQCQPVGGEGGCFTDCGSPLAAMVVSPPDFHFLDKFLLFCFRISYFVFCALCRCPGSGKKTGA